MKKTIMMLLLLGMTMGLLASCQLPMLPNNSVSSSENALQSEIEGESSNVSETQASSDTAQNSESNSFDSSSATNSAEDTNDGHLYKDFTPAEKQLFMQYIGIVVPFVANDEYYVEGYYDETGYEYGMNFYTVGNSEAEFFAYLTKFTDYTLAETYQDDYGDTWYCYEKDDVVVDVSYYLYDGDSWIDLYVYSSLSKDPEDDEYPDYDDDFWGDIGGDIGGDADVTVLTNAGKGLPKGANGVYNVDFNKATYVKNVTEQGYYEDGCPTVSTGNTNPAVLVIPVEFSDVTAASKGYTVDKIKTAFNGATGATDYYSVSDYYNRSSYGKLTLDITVLDTWFRPQYTSNYYENARMDYDGEQIAIGDQMVMDEALASLESKLDLSKFDSDGNNIIDAVVLITTLEIDPNVDFYWAFRYWNLYTDDEGDYYEYDGVSANDYLWASYQFIYETTDSSGVPSYTNTQGMNTYTYIHEFGHILGADDYYDTSYSGSSPLDGYDIMDSMYGDHNPYTKFNYGWLTTSRLVVAEQSVTLTLEAFSNQGDTIILANNWDETLGVYQEYYVLIYYTNSDLNMGEGGYFSKNGIVVYHVNASLYQETIDGITYYDVYNNNTSIDESGYGTKDNLIELVTTSDGDYVHTKGDKLRACVDDNGNTLQYTFTVDALTEDNATITFTKR